MTPKIDLVNVKVSINGKEQTIKMERGTRFENKGGIFTAGENNGVLKMTNYQLQAFKAMANNYGEEGETGIVLSKKDIQEAQRKYKNGGFVTDMSEFLPEGYKIERPKLTSTENMVQAYVTNGKEAQSATLKFSFVNTNNNLTNKNNEIKSTIDKKDVDVNLANKTIKYKHWGNTYTITYNENGKPVSYRTTSLDPDENYIYDKNGRLVEVKYPTRVNRSKKYTYHENGNIAKCIKNLNQDYSSTEIKTYSPDGKIIKSEEIVENDPKNGHTVHTYSYDANGNLKNVITVTNMTERREGSSYFEVLPRYTIIKYEGIEQCYKDYYKASSFKVLGFSDSADYKKSGLQESYTDKSGFVISVDDREYFGVESWDGGSIFPEPIYPWEIK